jgi:ABC-2 type transport system ATP-binding protein
MIQVKDLRKNYSGTETLHGLNFEINKGEIVGFLGPNGAGKTTTMRIITGYLPPSSGSVKIAGYDVVNESLNARKHIGYLPEHVPLYLDLTVNEYLEFFAKIMKISNKQIKDHLNEIKQKTGLSVVAHKQIGSLSRGYRQRVGIAQALIGQPEVLILDEPTVGLDPVQIIEIRDLIKALAKHQTVILSTHILPEVNMICDRVIIINKGDIVADSNVQELLSNNKIKNSYEFLIGSNPSEAEAIIKSFSSVTSHSVVAQDKRSLIKVAARDDIRSELLKSLVLKNVDLVEFKTEKTDLESIFLKLVTSEKN